MEIKRDGLTRRFDDKLKRRLDARDTLRRIVCAPRVEATRHTTFFIRVRKPNSRIRNPKCGIQNLETEICKLKSDNYIYIYIYIVYVYVVCICSMYMLYSIFMIYFFIFIYIYNLFDNMAIKRDGLTRRFDDTLKRRLDERHP